MFYLFYFLSFVVLCFVLTALPFLYVSRALQPFFSTMSPSCSELVQGNVHEQQRALFRLLKRMLKRNFTGVFRTSLCWQLFWVLTLSVGHELRPLAQHGSLSVLLRMMFPQKADMCFRFLCNGFKNLSVRQTSFWMAPVALHPTPWSSCSRPLRESRQPLRGGAQHLVWNSGAY